MQIAISMVQLLSWLVSLKVGRARRLPGDPAVKCCLDVTQVDEKMREICDGGLLPRLQVWTTRLVIADLRREVLERGRGKREHKQPHEVEDRTHFEADGGGNVGCWLRVTANGGQEFLLIQRFIGVGLYNQFVM